MQHRLSRGYTRAADYFFDSDDEVPVPKPHPAASARLLGGGWSTRRPDVYPTFDADVPEPGPEPKPDSSEISFPHRDHPAASATFVPKISHPENRA